MEQFIPVTIINEVIFWLCFKHISVLEKVSDYTALQIPKHSHNAAQRAKHRDL